MAPPKGKQRSGSDADTDSTSAMFQQILTELKSINKRIETVETKVNSIERSLEYHIEEVDELKAKVEVLETELPPTIIKVHDLELNTLRKSIEIQGIPHDSEEKLNDIVLKLATLKSISMDINNIDLAYRNKSKKSIVIRFMQSHKRDAFLSAFKGKHDITAASIGFRNCSFKVYVNELLSFETRNLFYKARKLKEELQYKFVWTVNQRVYLRKDQNSNAILIKNECELVALKNGS